MYMSGDSLLIIMVVGLIAGWLAGEIVQGTGFGIVGDLLIGIAGAFVGSWLLPQLGLHLGSGMISAIINAAIGALLLLLIIRLVRGGRMAKGLGRKKKLGRQLGKTLVADAGGRQA
ncbi:MAG: GlsB/YeaQ/YmgE family stress response membrane protein [Xanthobacteraceae bacterium]